MNRTKLKEAEARFFRNYPGGFSNPLMLEIAKKHKVEKMNKLAQESLAIEQFENPIKMLMLCAKSSANLLWFRFLKSLNSEI